jgi:CheY-like chemotaxis protein
MITNRCIYLAEDDDDDAFFFSTALRSCFPDYQCVHFANGSLLLAALHEASQPYPERIFLDVQMPLMNGAETYQALQAHPVWSLVPVCLLTSSQDLAYAAQNHGINRHLLHTKPSTIEALKSLILDHMPN